MYKLNLMQLLFEEKKKLVFLEVEEQSTFKQIEGEKDMHPITNTQINFLHKIPFHQTSLKKKIITEKILILHMIYFFHSFLSL